MSLYKCIICEKTFLCRVGLISHLEKAHIENAQRQNKETGDTTIFVVEVEVPEISMYEEEELEEVRTEFVEIKVSATTVTTSPESENVDSSVEELKTRIVGIISENTIDCENTTIDLTITSSETESAYSNSSPDVDAQENDLDAPPNLVAEVTDQSLESRTVHGNSSPEIEILENPTTVASSQVIVRTETVITETTYELSRTLVSGTTDGSSESGSVDGTSAPEVEALETTSNEVLADKIAEITSSSGEAIKDSSDSLDKYLCYLCNRRFRSPANLHDHKMQYHAEVMVRTKTVITETTYKSSRTLVSGTTDEPSESGSVDGTSAPEIEALETTSNEVSADKIAEITSGSDEAIKDSSESLDKYLCHLCNRRFRSPANLHDHKMLHHERR